MQNADMFISNGIYRLYLKKLVGYQVGLELDIVCFPINLQFCGIQMVPLHALEPNHLASDS